MMVLARSVCNNNVWSCKDNNVLLLLSLQCVVNVWLRVRIWRDIQQSFTHYTIFNMKKPSNA